jgi:rRNA-processing protein FCF1
VIAYLDTNVVVWLAQGSIDRISRKAQGMLEQADLLISPMVLIELEYLYEINRIKLPSRDVQLKIEHEIGVAGQGKWPSVSRLRRPRDQQKLSAGNLVVV